MDAPDSDSPGPPTAATSVEATRLLRATLAGAPGASEELLPLVYDQLRALASAYLAGERRGHTLQATALVHEAWMRLIDRRDADAADREHFLALAAQTMRRVLVDHARARGALKRGGDRARITLSGSDQVDLGTEHSLVEFADLLEKLGTEHERMGQVATLRLFGGLEHAEIARVLDVVESTVYADWKLARAWLTRALKGEPSS